MQPGTDLTYEELAEWYLNLEKVKSLNSYDRKVIAVKRFNKVFGHKLVNDVLRTDLENYQITRGKVVKPRTVDYEIGEAKTIVNEAFLNKKISGDVVLAFKSLKSKLRIGSNARKRTASIEEYINLVNAAAEELKAIIIMAFNTGMRRGEIKKLRWTHIDFKEGFVRLPAEIVKEKKSKKIPLNHHARAVLIRLRPRKPKLKDSSYHDFVFTYRGKPIKYSFQRQFETACKNAGIDYGRKKEDGLCFHDLRATVKTNMVEADVKKEYRDAILGHSATGMDKHYLRFDEDVLKKAMEDYTEWLDAELNKVSGIGQHLVNTWSTNA